MLRSGNLPTRPWCTSRSPESIKGNLRTMLEQGLSLTPGLERVRASDTDGVERVLFRTTRNRARALLGTLPPEMVGYLVTRLDSEMEKELCPA